MSLNASTEMYLESIYVLHHTKGCVHSIDVAKYLNFSKASVSRAIGILKQDGYISVDSDGSISLTPSGEAAGHKIYERHTVLTDVLVALGVDKTIAAENACRIEHVITDEAFDAIKSYFQNKKL